MNVLRLLFPEGRRVVLEQGNATCAKVARAGEDGPYRLVHFAAHGLFNERRPHFSGLLLSCDDATGDDGFLTVGEVFGLTLECDQVVLSACSSALGEKVTGEGLVGLTRAFLYAGARDVVAALWEVSGKTTAKFMKEFYAEISAAKGGEPARALADAKRRMITGADASPPADVTLSHPYFWAPFVMVGSGQ